MLNATFLSGAQPLWRTLILSLAISIVGLLPQPADASWEIRPEVDTSVRFETNPGLATDSQNEDEATSLEIFFELPVTYETERTLAVFTPRYLRSFYAESSDSDLEDEDLILPLRYRYRWLRAEAGFYASYSDLSVRTSEFDSVDPDGDIINGSGSTRVVDDSQIRWRFDPYYRYNLSERNALSLSGRWSDVSYDRDTSITRRFDYDSGSVSAGWTHSFNARNAVSLILSGGYYESEANNAGVSNETDSYSARLAYERGLSERTTLTVTGGVSNTDWESTFPQLVVNGNPVVDADGNPVCDQLVDIDGDGIVDAVIPIACVQSGDDTNFVGGIDLTSRTETDRFTISLDQEIRPSSGGVTTLSTVGRVFWRKRWSERFSSKIGTVLVRNEDVGSTSDRERTFANAEATFRYRITQMFALRGGYRLKYDDFTNVLGIDEGDAENHIFFLGLSWTGKGWRW